MARIFISHSSADDFAARAVVDWLAREGWDDVFLDFSTQQGIAPGERWRQALHDAANRCEAVIFLVSRAWLDSEWCRREFVLAARLNKRMFAMIIDAAIGQDDIPPDLADNWQVASLATGSDHDIFRASDRYGAEGHITFSRSALRDLRTGLARAGLDPRHFAWPPPSDPQRAPYRGLAPLDIEDAGIFYGREGPILEAMDQLRGLRDAPGPRMVAIIGASGAGKSSFLRAGLLPRMTRDDRNFLPLPVIRPERAALYGATGLLPALETALLAAKVKISRATLRADVEAGGDRLLERLKALTPAEGDPAIVIAIDQAEEAFTTEGRTEGEQLLVRLRALAEARDLKVLVIFTIRSDAFEYLQTTPVLEGAPPRTFNLPPMPRGAFQTIIEGPAARFGQGERHLAIDPKLVGALLADVDGAGKDALPLLSFTLSRLFIEHGGDGDLTLAEYREGLGGLGGAIDSAVALAFAEADADPAVPRDRETRLALVRRGLIPWLAGIDLATNAPRRKVARWDDLPPESRPLIRHFVDQRLLSSDVDANGTRVVEPAHEALLRQWGLLKRWLVEDFGLLSILEGVQQAARDWIASGRDPAFLPHTEGRLASAELVAARPDLGANLLAQDNEYLEACRALERGRRYRERQRQRRLLWTSIAAALVLAATSVVGIVQWRLAEDARADAVAATIKADNEARSATEAQKVAVNAQALEAAAREEAVEAQLAALDRQAEAARLAVLGGLRPGEEARDAVRTLAANLPADDVVLTQAHHDLFATGYRAIDQMSMQPWKFSFNDAGGNWRMITDLTASAGGNYIAVGLYQTWAAIIDTRTMRIVSRFRGTGDKIFDDFAFNDTETAILQRSFDTWAVFDRGDSRPRFSMRGCLRAEQKSEGSCAVSDVGFGPLGTIVSAHDDGARIFDPLDGTEIAHLGSGPTIGAELDTTERYLLAYEGSSIFNEMTAPPLLRVWDWRDGQEVFSIAAGKAGDWIHGRLFGSLVLVLREGQPGELWDFVRNERIAMLSEGQVQGYAIDAAAGRLAVIANDGAVSVFDQTGARIASWTTGITLADNQTRIQLALGKDFVFVARPDGRVQTFDQLTGLSRGTVTAEGGLGPVTRMVFVPKVDRLALAHEGNALRVWPLEGLMAPEILPAASEGMPVQVDESLVYPDYDGIEIVSGPTLAIKRTLQLFDDDGEPARIHRVESLQMAMS